MQLPASILPFHVAPFLAVNYCKDKLLYANLRLNLLCFQHFLSELLRVGAGSHLWALAVPMPQLRAGSVAAFEAQVPGTVSDSTDKTQAGGLYCRQQQHKVGALLVNEY